MEGTTNTIYEIEYKKGNEKYTIRVNAKNRLDAYNKVCQSRSIDGKIIAITIPNINLLK